MRRWLEKNHATARELWVGFYKKGSGRASVTYPEALDEALCFGWIDGVRKTVDAASYVQRFTPRRPRSNWSRVNIKRVSELKAAGRLAPPGVAAFAQRDPARVDQYSFENAPRVLPPDYERTFSANARAWAFFQAQPPGYRRLAAFYVMSAKKEETRARRLKALIALSAKGRRLTDRPPPTG